MPRKYNSTQKYLRPDPRFDSLLVSKFINQLMFGLFVDITYQAI